MRIMYACIHTSAVPLEKEWVILPDRKHSIPNSKYKVTGRVMMRRWQLTLDHCQARLSWLVMDATFEQLKQDSEVLEGAADRIDELERRQQTMQVPVIHLTPISHYCDISYIVFVSLWTDGL